MNKLSKFLYTIDTKLNRKEDTDYAILKASILRTIEKDWGHRCAVKDTDEFDDLVTVGNDSSRCPCCLVYEKFDNFWDYFAGQYEDNR